jgi:hypothetical protein
MIQSERRVYVEGRLVLRRGYGASPHASQPVDRRFKSAASRTDTKINARSWLSSLLEVAHEPRSCAGVSSACSDVPRVLQASLFPADGIGG